MPDEVPMTPTQRYYLDACGPNFAIYSLLDAPPGVTPQMIEQAALELRRRHDALRLAVYRDGQRWRQHIVPASTDGQVFREVDLRGVWHVPSTGPGAGKLGRHHQRLPRRVMELIHELHQALAPERGEMFKVAALHTPEGLQWLVVVNHFAADTVSSVALAQETYELLFAALEGAGEKPYQGPPSFAELAHSLKARSTAPEVLAQLPFWKEQEQLPAARLPWERILPEDTDFTESSLFILPAAVTEGLKRLTQADAQLRDVVLTAVAFALQRWTDGGTRFRLCMASHGREGSVNGRPTWGTVGFLAVLWPYSLGVPSARAPQAAVSEVAAGLKRVQNSGADYGLLRYLPGGQEWAEGELKLALHEFLFDYLGTLDRELMSRSSIFVGPHERRPMPLALLSAQSPDGSLWVDLRWSTARYREPQIDAFMAALRAELERLAAEAP